MGLNMKRSAFRSGSGQIAFSKGYLCALSISGVFQGAMCVLPRCHVRILCCEIKYSKWLRKHLKSRKAHNASEILQKDINND